MSTRAVATALTECEMAEPHQWETLRQKAARKLEGILGEWVDVSNVLARS